MPKRRTAKRWVAPMQTETPIKVAPVPFTLEEREQLKIIFSNPLFVRAWNNARWSKPSAFPHGSQAVPMPLASPLGLQIGNNLLHEIRGWELFEAALLSSIKDPPPKRAPISEKYQEP